MKRQFSCDKKSIRLSNNLLSEGACSVREANRAVSEREAFANNASEDFTVTFGFLDTFYPSRFSKTTALRDMLFGVICS